MSEAFTGAARFVRVFPFAMRPWEMRIMYRSFGMTAGGEWLTGMPDLSGNGNDAKYPSLPKWFRLWLWLRTKWAQLKRWVD